MPIPSFQKILVILATLLPILTWAQVDKGFKLLEAGDLAGAWSLFEQAAKNEKEKGYAHFGQSQVLGDERYPDHNLDSAYYFLTLAEAAYRSLSYKDRERWDDFSIAEIRKRQKDLQTRKVASVLQSGDPARVEEVLGQYDRLSGADKAALMEARNRWLWETVAPADLPAFFHRYHADFSAWSPALLRTMEDRLFEQEVGAQHWERYPSFAQQFPEHSYVRLRLMEKLEALRPERDPAAWFSFIDQYGKTHFRTLALDSLASAVAYQGDLADCERYVSEYMREHPHEPVWQHYYNLYKRYKFSQAAIESFVERHPAFPFPEQLQKDLDFFLRQRFERLITTGFTVSEAQSFLETYPDYPGIEKLWRRYYKVYKLSNPTPEDVERFAAAHPDFPFPDSLAAERLEMINRRADGLLNSESVRVQGFLNFLQQYPETDRRAAIWRRIYSLETGPEPDIKKLDDFARRYPHYPFLTELQAEKQERIDALGFALVQNEHISPSSCLEFIEQYPESEHVGPLWRRVYRLYKEADDSPAGLQTFLDQYPGYPFPEEVEADRVASRRVYEKQLFEEIVDIHRALRFLEEYPDSKYRPSLETPFYRMLAGSSRLSNLTAFLEHYPQSRYRQEVLRMIYTTMTQDGNLAAILAFEEQYPDFRDRQRIERDKALTEIPNMIGVDFTESRREAFESYIRRAAPDMKAYRVLRRYLAPEIQRKEWAAAAEKARSFQQEFGKNNGPYNELLAILSAGNADGITPEPIPGPINTPSEEYAPFISVDGQTLLFCGRFRPDNLVPGKEDIFISQLTDGEWQPPKLLTDLSAPDKNEAPEALSADGNTLILFVEGKLGLSEKNAIGWDPMQKLPATINRSRWQADARITADGKAMLFASTNGAYGAEDIYVSLRDEAGNWGEAINLGPVINTEQVDRTPFLHPDMKTLYFCSEGHTGLGKMDIFMSRRLDEHSWTQWSEPVNLGTAVNTAGHDWDFKVTTDGAFAYFTVSNDIYRMELPKAFQPERVATISGKLLGIDGKPLAAEIVWEDLETGRAVQVSKSDPQSGYFFATLPNKGVFGYTVRREGYFPLSGNVDFTESVSDVKLEKDMILATVEEMKASDLRLPLNNLFFETGKYDIRPHSFPELNRLAEWIRTYDLQIEILGHTDHVGEDTDNQLLSQNRAEAVRIYLLDRGAPGDQMMATGFGESQPVAPNETAEGRAMNRRVEIRIRN